MVSSDARYSRPEAKQWYVMRDLKRHNALRPAYVMLEELGMRYFTPMTWRVSQRGGRSVRQRVPYMPDLVFVYDSRAVLDPIVEQVATFQYRYLRGTYREPMTVRESDMERFMLAVSVSDEPRYYSPSEITPSMYRRRVRMVGGRLDGCEGYLLSTRGSRVRRLLVELPELLAASVEVEADYIQLL